MRGPVPVEVLYFLIPIGLVFLLIAIRMLFWAINSGQYEDLETEANRILFDDAPPVSKPPADISSGEDMKATPKD
ncbi:MAG: cbb3-type cytochrome oxidase maturation protein [Cellvibrionaceae bacterium]